MTSAPAFYLNSRNRPGPLSIPGEMGSLNFIPEAPLQPSDLGGDEYQTNDAMAWVIRTALAQTANVVPNARVISYTSVGSPKGCWEVTLEDGRKLYAKRVIAATGLGKEKGVTNSVTSDRVLNFQQFMQRMDSPFPLRGMKRVAVIGAGDGAKTVIESLSGKGPSRGYSVAALDWPEKISWYGAPAVTAGDWLACNRARYKPIASLLPSGNGRVPRVDPQPKAETIGVGYNSVYIGQTPFDYVITATGYDGASSGLNLEGFVEWDVERRRVGKRYENPLNKESPIFVVGPAANLVLKDGEDALLKGIAENAASIFRYAPRTAALAGSLA